MRLPRLKIRTLMIAVAIVAVLISLGIWTRRHQRRFDELIMTHRRASWWMEMAGHYDPKFAPGSSKTDGGAWTAELRWRDDMAHWYADRLWRPWAAMTDTPTPAPGACRFHRSGPGIAFARDKSSGAP